MGLRAESFIIDDDSSLPAKKVRNSHLPQPDHQCIPELSLKSRSSKKSLGTLKDIWEKRTSCPFCNLIAVSIAEPKDDLFKRYADMQDVKCYANWEIDGRQAIHETEGRVNGRTRRIHLSWSKKGLRDSYLVFVAPKKYNRPNSDAQYVWENEALFLGRDINLEGGIQALTKSWLDLCRESHGGPCSDTPYRPVDFGRMLEQSYFGVIDVLDLQLTSLPHTVTDGLSAEDMDTAEAYDTPNDYYGHHSDTIHQANVKRYMHEPYVALSYVWGQGRELPYTTKLSNIMTHRKHGGLEKCLPRLPQVIQDAIVLVRRLGMRYIWVDSLCIVQNSNRSWNLNASVMDLIYGNAALTVCAADGNDSSAGLMAMYPTKHNVHQAKKTCAPGVRLMVSRPPEIGIRASKWDNRAWTFQERLLSKRCLIFSEGRVYFQCQSTGMSEDIFADRKGAGWSLDLIHAPLQMLRELSRRAFWVYVECVKLYTSRDLTKPEDILAAFTGLCNLMEMSVQAPFVFGLPTSHFDLALLWEPTNALGRRRISNKEADNEKVDGEKANQQMNSKKGGKEARDAKFPSWSWCGWMDTTMEYKSGIVEGCLTNVHEWLTKHTWIHWYVRDGRGNLRPLWDGKKSTEDNSTEKRWKGYRSGHSDVRVPVPGSHGNTEGKRRWRKSRNKRRKDRARDRSEESVIREGQIADDGQLRECDDYGRVARDELATLPLKQFKLILPENPYKVVVEDFGSTPDAMFPDQPLLQFWTWHTSLHLVPSDIPRPHPQDGLCRYDIADAMGDWCGSLSLNETWMRDAKGESEHEFIAISEAKAFTSEECDVWTYYIPKEREQSEWDLYYVLLLERDRRGMKWERVAVGKVFKAAFAGAEWKEIILG